MKKIASIPFLLALLVLSAMTAQGQLPANHLEGTWRLVSQRAVYPDTIIVTATIPPSMKILNSTHFSWGYQSDDGEDVLAGGGRYTLQADTLYTEYIEYHTSPVLIGLPVRFTAKVVGDLWYHTGEFPSGYRLEEVWRRLE
jgi:hypothetical protein